LGTQGFRSVPSFGFESKERGGTGGKRRLGWRRGGFEWAAAGSWQVGEMASLARDLSEVERLGWRETV